MATYQANHYQFARLMKSSDIRDFVRFEADRFAAHLAAVAPKDTGAYASNFKVATGLDILQRDRVAAFVYNDSAYATALEVGSWTIKNPPAPMTNALDSFHT